MLRTFETHKIRKTTELSGRLWDFTALSGDKEGVSMKVMVPSCLETYPGFGNYRGLASYETSFEAEGNIRLEFKGVSHFARVFVDGEETAQHYGSYTPFDICVKNLSPGMHSLKVIVDNDFRDEYVLDFPNDYMSYGGISRGVVLEYIKNIYIDWIHVTPLREADGIWSIRAEVACQNLSESPLYADVRLKFLDTEACCQGKLLPPGKSIITFEELEIADACPWSMEDPVLYQVSASLLQNGAVVDDMIERTGLRLVRVEGTSVLLNNKPLRIKGFCRHEDHPQYGCALPAEAIAYDLQLIKDLGANSVRTSHYPNDELFLDMCDELGILVWEENHARGINGDRMKSPYFEEQCEQVIREMITAHYNHPSIYIWGILNECGSETEYEKSCYRRQYDLIRHLDKSRPCSSASCRFGTDICQDLPDVCSWNIYPYWYDDDTASQKLQKLHDWLNTDGNGGGKPLLITEVGAGSIYGFRDTSSDVWSEDLQAEILEKQLKEIAASDDYIGMYIWQFCDVRVSRIWWALRRPKSRNNKGIVDEYRRPKLAYRIVRDIFTSLPNYREK